MLNKFDYTMQIFTPPKEINKKDFSSNNVLMNRFEKSFCLISSTRENILQCVLKANLLRLKFCTAINNFMCNTFKFQKDI